MIPLPLFPSVFCCYNKTPKINSLARGKFTLGWPSRSLLLSRLFWGTWQWRIMMWLRKFFILATGKQRKRLNSQYPLQRHTVNDLAFFHWATAPTKLTISKEHHNLVSKPLKWSFWGTFKVQIITNFLTVTTKNTKSQQPALNQFAPLVSIFFILECFSS